MAVFPVWRSPIINSLWPRPIGIMASIALIPVWRGSLTGWRKITPGALRSMGSSIKSPSIIPLPSIGSPKVLITRPKRPSPTFMEAILPVRLQRSPSLSSFESPNNTTPTLSSSRLRTIPMTVQFGFSNTTNSPEQAFWRPYTRAMPSPTNKTVPVSSNSVFESKLCNCWRSIAVTSDGLISDIVI